MQIIDSHLHYNPGRRQNQLVKEMNDASIGSAVILSPADICKWRDDNYKLAREITSIDSKLKVAPLVQPSWRWVDYDVIHYLDILLDILKDKMVGVKLYEPSEFTTPDTGVISSLLENKKLQEKIKSEKLVVFYHPRSYDERTRRLYEQLIKKIDNLFVCPHLMVSRNPVLPESRKQPPDHAVYLIESDGFNVYDLVEKEWIRLLMEHSNLYTDISSPRSIAKHLPVALEMGLDTGKILFGSDHTVDSRTQYEEQKHDPEYTAIYSPDLKSAISDAMGQMSNLSRADRNKIFYGNAKRIFRF